MSSHIPWEQVYVFVSSTFHDMHAERDYLVKRVFPELAEWCERRRLHLTDVDLRWGVTEKDAVDNQNAVKVCLHHIDACRPFFLCFLGQRRGWIPEAVSDETLETYPGVREFVGRASITELEILHAMVQPMGGDHPRGRSDESFFYLRLPTFLAQQPAEPRSIRDVYTNGGSPGEAFHDQLLSEWREEIIPSLGRPVHFYEATWNSSGSTPEIAIPLESPGASLRSEHWRRRWRDAGINLPPGTKEIPSQLVTEAVEFNRILTRGRLGTFRTADPVDESSSDGDDRGSPLSQAVLSDLKRAIDARFPGRDDVSHADPLQQELDQQDEFRFNLIQGFVERPGVFADLNRYLNDPTDRRLFVLTGEPGVGKSALLAKWVETFLFGTVDRYSERTCHMRFVGAGDRSTVVDDLMRSLLLELQQHQKIDSELPPDPEKLQRMWPDFLEQAGQHGPTVFVIDALDQLETGLGEVDWLLETLPPNVKMIISFAEGTPNAKELCARFVENRKVIVVRAEPFAGAKDRRLLVDTFLDAQVNKP